MTKRQIHIDVTEPEALALCEASGDVMGFLSDECAKRGYEFLLCEDSWQVHSSKALGFPMIRFECLVQTLPTPDFMLLP